MVAYAIDESAAQITHDKIRTAIADESMRMESVHTLITYINFTRVNSLEIISDAEGVRIAWLLKTFFTKAEDERFDYFYEIEFAPFWEIYQRGCERAKIKRYWFVRSERTIPIHKSAMAFSNAILTVEARCIAAMPRV